MGAWNFIEFGEGATAQEAFDELVERAVWKHGHDPYNGTISTTRLNGRHTVRVADEWGEEAREAAIAEAEANDWGEKRESRVIDCGAVRDGRGRMWAFYGWAAC